MYVICYGDSNTYGYDPRSFLGGRYDPEYRWPDILAAELNWTVCNEGINGREIPKEKADFDDNADLVLIMLGANDLLQGCSPEETASKMRRFLDGADPKKILLISPPAFAPGEWVADQKMIDDSFKLAQYYRTLAEERHFSYMDASKWHIPLCFDGVHFTERGHILFAENLIRDRKERYL